MALSPQPLPTQRHELIARLAEGGVYDIAVVGGGATGLGVALDAAARGFRVVLVESLDFAKGTSSRATKLVHGGVRYLAQGNLALVREALHERSILLNNAPHLAQAMPFVVPSYQWWEKPFYGLGLKLYETLAAGRSLGRTEFLSRAETLALLPALAPQGLRGGVKYWDGQFDDARLALALARTAATLGALLVNYCRATDLVYDNGSVAGLVCQDALTGKSYGVKARCVVNAAGVWVDELRQKDGLQQAGAAVNDTPAMVAASQGVHVVVDREFLGANVGLMVPKTEDGRVLFAVPWLGKVILGTTDTPRQDLAREPRPFTDEVDFILRESARYLCRPPFRADIRSIWVGLRPLVKPPHEHVGSTKALSREHLVLVSRSGLLTVAGGKWTTYRAMAEDVLDAGMQHGLLEHRAKGFTVHLKLVGAQVQPSASNVIGQSPGMHLYGDEQSFLMGLPGANTWICDGLSEAMVRFAARYEYAIKVEDVLARRSRLLFLDAGLAGLVATQVGRILEEETGLDPDTLAFSALATLYLQVPD